MTVRISGWLAREINIGLENWKEISWGLTIDEEKIDLAGFRAVRA